MSSIDECRISLKFSKIHIPCVDISSCLIHLKYEDKQYRFSYPQKEPFIMKFLKPFTKQKSTIVLTVLVPTGKKFRRLGKGMIHIYKKYFYSNNLSFEKWIYLSLSQSQLQQMAFNTDIITAEMNGGQIYLSASLLDPIPKGVINAKLFSDFNSNSLLKSASKKIAQEKEKVTSNKTEKFRSVVEGNNAFLRKLKSGKVSNNTSLNYYSEYDKGFKDDFSDVSMSQLSYGDDAFSEYRIIPSINLKVDKILVNTEELLQQIDNCDLKEHLTKNVDKQRDVYVSINEGMKKISDQYIKCISEISAMNAEIRKDAKNFYNEYSKEKEKFISERKAMSNKNKKLEAEVQVNIKNNKSLQESILKEKLENKTLKVRYADKISNDNDINTMIDILNTFQFFNVDIGKGLNKEESEHLNAILSKRNKILYDLTTNNNMNTHLVGSKENYNLEEESEKIIDSIEAIVNSNFNQKKIPRIKIEQIDCYSYLFNDIKVVLYYDDNTNTLRCEDGKDFELWLLETFKY